MKHYPESHLSTLSRSLFRISKDEINAILKDRERLVKVAQESSNIEDTDNTIERNQDE